MGVPKFFRYISERYPCLSELVRENEIPEFDNLYLDMNGIIHNCSHPSDDIHFRLSEEQMFRDIFSYLEMLFKMIKPIKIFFMAIDGVAPRAKMNQQRGRRFRSAKDVENQEKAANLRGETLPTEKRFDSNCITPGTEFMVRLNEALKYFIKLKISTDPLWQHCEIILSGHETPGEGEHKIMEYIRFLQSDPNHDFNTRHCLYGLDADLIMLGLCTHEKHFSLLREEVKFGKQNVRAPTSIYATKFFLLHLSLLRDYLGMEFSAIKDKLKFPYDIDNIIDDWILMGFLVGNDFIPNLPNLHISSAALPTLYEVYMKVLPDLDGYINNNGELNLERFEKFMSALGTKDKELFASNQMDFKPFEKQDETFLLDDLDPTTASADFDFQEMVTRSRDMVLSDDDDSDISEAEMNERVFLKHREAYYKEKLNYPEMNEDVRREQAECYVTAIQWNLFYYYRGVASWSWFYPHHYSPFISDIYDFKDLKITFDLSKPFLPFQQLLSVLPAASKQLVPEAYHPLMTDANSKIVHFYPTDFATDLNGKKQEWEAVVLIPFINETLLLQEMSKCESNLTKHEADRNIHGPMLLFKYSTTSQGSCDGPTNFVHIANVYSTEEKIDREVFVAASKGIIKSTVENVLFYPGFPTLRHLKYSGEIRNVRVSVFDQPSRNESMVIKIENTETNDSAPDSLAVTLIGKTVYVNWPFLTEAKVVKVSDSCNIYFLDRDGHMQSTNNERWRFDVSAIQNHHMNRMGIDVGNIKSIVHVVVRLGVDYVFKDGSFVVKKTYSQHEISIPSQTVVTNVLSAFKKYEDTLKGVDVLKFGTSIFMTVSPFYGCFGEVVDSALLKKSCRIKVALMISEEPDLKSPKDIHYGIQRSYINSATAAAQVGISDLTFQRITDGVYYVDGAKREYLENGTPKRNIALQLKSKKNNEVIFGYTKRMNKQWFYSEAAIAVIKEYIDEFPKLIKCVEQGNSLVFESDLECETDTEKYANRVLNWLKEKKLEKPPFTSAHSEVAEKDSISPIIEAVRLTKIKPLRRVLLQVKPTAVFLPELNFSNQPMQGNLKFRLFDRVVVCSKGQKAPVGYKGTIISVHHITDKNPVRQGNVNKVEDFFDILFDKPFEGGLPYLDINEACVARIAKIHLINISRTGESDNRNTMEINDKPIQYNNDKKEPLVVETKGTKEVSTLNSLWESMKSANTKGNNEVLQKIPKPIFEKSINAQPRHSSEIVMTNGKKEEQESNMLKALLGINSSSSEQAKMLPPPPECWKVAPPEPTKLATPFIPLQVMRKTAEPKVSGKPTPVRVVNQTSNTKSQVQKNVPCQEVIAVEHVAKDGDSRPHQRRKRRIAAKFKNIQN